MKILSRTLWMSLGCALLVLCLVVPASALNTMVSYQQHPPTITVPTKPNVLILMSNDWTGFTKGYHEDYDNSVDYWGYFDNRKEYEYLNAGYFTPKGFVGPDHFTSNVSYWSGNWLNWANMSHADFLRKALTGGKRANDTPYGTKLIRAVIPAGESWKKQLKGPNLDRLVKSTYATVGNWISVYDTEMVMLDSSQDEIGKNKQMNVIVQTCLEALPETSCSEYPNGLKPEGLLQRYRNDMLFGLMSYSHTIPDQGGIVRQQIKDLGAPDANIISETNGGVNSGANSMLTYIETYTQKGWDPLAEMFYDGVRYLRGNESAQAAYCPSSTDDSFKYFGCAANNKWEDPITSWCQKNSIVIINDEYPSAEEDRIPNSVFNPTYRDTPAFGTNDPAKAYNPDVVSLLAEITAMEKTYGSLGATGLLAKKFGSNVASCTNKVVDNLANFSGICASEPTSRGTFSLAALAYDALKNDMRADKANAQNFRTYAIAFRASSGTYYVPKPPLNQMYLAGKYGNYDEMGGVPGPDLDAEWMKSADLCAIYPDSDNCLPKGFFYAEGGDKIEKALIEAFEAILRKSASGTSVSVLATSGKGEGNLVQAYYRPTRPQIEADGSKRTVAYTGYLQSLWIDKYGNLREDTDTAPNTPPALDVTKDKIVKYYTDAAGDVRIMRYAVSASDPYPSTVADSNETAELADMTSLWEAGQQLADTSSTARKIFTSIDLNNDGRTDSTEVVDFKLTSTAIFPYLALQDSTPENGFGQLGKTEENRIQNLIAFTRGDDPREVPLPSSFIDPDYLYLRDRRIDGKVWKLGDIVNSTPVSLSAPPDRFDLIYGDESYGKFYAKYKNRESMVYAGANDGMLHAFTTWRYNQSAQSFEDPKLQDTSLVTLPIGSEVWAYIPQNLLPHLKWLSRPDYTHVFYMDMQPRIFDAQIYSDTYDATNHPGGWATVMVVGMNTGGGFTSFLGDFNASGPSVRRNFSPSYMAFDITDPRNPVLLWERAYDGLGFTRAIPTAMRVEDSTGYKWVLVFGNGPDSGSATTEPNYKGESSNNGRIYIVNLADGTPYSKITPAEDWWDEVPDPKAFFNAPIAYDRGLDFNVDAAYMATAYNAETNASNPAIWKGSVYRILTMNPDYDPDLLPLDTDPPILINPNDWTLSKIFDSPGPITAPGNLSGDSFGNIWAYFGTGRYLDNADDGDKVSLAQEYLFGIKDPFFNKYYNSTTTKYYKDFDNNKVLQVPGLMNSTPIEILTNGEVKCFDGVNTYTNPQLALTTFDRDTTQPCDSTGAAASTFRNLLTFAQAKDGWIRKLWVDPNNPIDPLDEASVASERNLNTPALLGGLAFFTTYYPAGDDCTFGGHSSLWALYYETGTAYRNSIFTGVDAIEWLSDGSGKYKASITLGSGSASSVGFHLGANGKVSALVQIDGRVETAEPKTAKGVDTGIRSWVERLD